MPPPSSSLPLPVIDLTPLSYPSPSPDDLTTLSIALSTAFSTTGFAYLVNAPLSFTHTSIFTLAHTFFSLPHETKMSIARRQFRAHNQNAYRGYFPVQEGNDNCKEGFDMGGGKMFLRRDDRDGNPDTRREGKLNLNEENVWPEGLEETRGRLERLHGELQSLSEKLLSLLAVALGKPEDHFQSWMENSLSTLRLLHYPALTSSSSPQQHQQQELCCTPHTDSGILTLLHQDSTGGLEILSAEDEDKWVPAPYVPDSIVVNIGDLMSKVSGGRFKATVHKVRSTPGKERYSVPFFFEPGAGCWVENIMDRMGEGVRYGNHVLEKMSGWVEFRDEGKDVDGSRREFEVGMGKEVMIEA